MGAALELNNVRHPTIIIPENGDVARRPDASDC